MDFVQSLPFSGQNVCRPNLAGGLYVARAVVYKQRLAGLDALGLDNMAEESLVGFHGPAFIAHVHRVHVMGYGMAHAVEPVAQRPAHHVSWCLTRAPPCSPRPQPEQGVEVASRHLLAITLPGIQALVGRHLMAYEPLRPARNSSALIFPNSRSPNMPLCV